MPRFLKRIFPEHLFRKEGADVSDIQRSRRVLVRPSPSNNALYEHAASNWRLGVFYDGDGDAGGSDAEERRALRDGASLAESRSEQQRVGEEEVVVVVPERKAERVRRRLSKRHRMPV